MKNGCEFEIDFEQYFRGNLPASKDIALQKHLQSCAICRQHIEEHYAVHIALKKYDRPDTSPDFSRDYHQLLDARFGKKSLTGTIKLNFDRALQNRSLVFRFAQLATLLLVGIVIGWYIFSPAETKVILQGNDPYQSSRPISKIDIDYLYYYLLASEMVLLEIQNTAEKTDLYLSRELAQKLLIKTFRVHEIALQINNLQMLKFLSRMELLLHEASNLTDEEIYESLDTIKMVIREAELIKQVKSLQKVFKQRRVKAGT